MFRKIKDAARVLKAFNQYEHIKKDIDTMDSKHLLFSKTFWANVLGLALTVGGILPTKYAAPVLTIANIGLRLLSNQPVNLFPSK